MDEFLYFRQINTETDVRHVTFDSAWNEKRHNFVNLIHMDVCKILCLPCDGLLEIFLGDYIGCIF